MAGRSPCGVVVVLLLMAGLLSTASAVNNSVPFEPYPMEGGNHTLTCTEEMNELKYFLLNAEGRALGVGDHQDDGISVYNDGTVFFHMVKLEHEGLHLCLLIVDGVMYSHKTTMRVRPLPPTDLWGARYKTMFVTGFISALVIGTLFVLFCLVYKKQYKPPAADRRAIIARQSYDNPVMSKDFDGDLESSKM